MLELVEDLKEDTEEAMRIEMAPWVQNYTVPMDELYTELTLDHGKQTDRTNTCKVR